jgi:hypothetical protein
VFPKSNPRHGNKNSSILHSTNPKRVVREVDYNPIDGAALALVSSHRESQIKGKLLTGLKYYYNICNMYLVFIIIIIIFINKSICMLNSKVSLESLLVTYVHKLLQILFQLTLHILNT